MFKIICIIAVLSCITASFANESIASAEPNLSQSEVAQLASDKTPEADESSVKSPGDKERSTLQRLQIGLFNNRADVDSVVVRLGQLDFETWIIPSKDGYAVSIGAFSSRSNLKRASKRLAKAGFADKIQVVEVDKTTQQAQVVEPTQIVRSTLVNAGASQAEEQYVPKKKYEKLEQEVELLKSQMRMLMEEKSSSQQSLKPTTKPVKQVSSEPSEPKTVATSSEESTPSRNESDDSQAKEEDESLAEGSRKEEAEDAKRQMDMFLRDQTVLYKRGELQFQFGLNYSQDTTVATCFNADNSTAFCPSGSTPIPKLNSRSVDTNLNITYGIADELALSLSIPYSYSEQEADFTAFDVKTPVKHSDQLGIGDVSGSLRYTAWHEKGSRPGITFNINAKSTTGDEASFNAATGNIRSGLGTGFWNVGSGVSLTKTFDPVVFFGSVGYTATLQDGGVDPGDQISYSFGGGFSLNDRVSVKTTFSGTTLLRTEVDGREIPGSAQDISSLQFSSTIKISKALFIEPFVAFGLTRESNDFTVGLRVPYRFGERFPLPFFHD